ncbi:M14 family zinc carboxypeptidase [Umezawaea sp. NPDC059074]|uniref:M14 family zinc carboxypeptidase n=1 Tax=Umezawaea sp. NPDC059074 TaxID=3346716 RepID=UPI00369902F9
MRAWRAVWLVAVVAVACTSPEAVTGGAELEQRRHAGAGSSSLPSGRTGYRTYAEVGSDLGELATVRADVVSRLALPHRTVLGVDVVGVEITHDVGKYDGKPVLVVVGAHNASDWASAEVAVEFATDLAEQDGRDPRVTALLDRVRVVVVPVVNPDGFQLSRAGTVPGKRGNCRVDFPASQSCATSPDVGVDLDRNYGVGWKAGDHRGAGAFSEPETRNVRELVAGRQVTVFATLGTGAGTVLRPSADESSTAVGQALADAGGWTSAVSAVGGTATEWVHGTTGGLAFAVEPRAGEYLDQYRGGAREALLRAGEAAGDRRYHAVVSGVAPAGARVTVRNTSGVRSSMVANGPFEWEVNPAEAWTLDCGTENEVLQSAEVSVGRGERVSVDLGQCSRSWG